MSRNVAHFYADFWNPSLQVLARMSREGFLLDCDQLNRKAELALTEAQELYDQLTPWATDFIRQREDQEPMNWNSPAQLSEFLYTFKAAPIPAVIGTAQAARKNTKKERSTSEASLQWLAKNAKSETDARYIRTLLQARRTTKLAQFMVKLPTMVGPDSKLRCSIGPNTDTGRLSSSNPNLQQIPTRNDKFGIRKAFVASPGKLLVVADYSQLEMYVIAHFLKHRLDDDSLANDLLSGDVHTNTAFRIWGKQLRDLGATPDTIKERPGTKRFRDNAKTVNYAIPYGKTAAGLGSQITDSDGRPIGKQAAQSILDAYFEAYPGMAKLFDLWKDEARSTGFVHTLLGRTRPLPFAASDNKWERFAAERRAVNTPVQGSAADIVTAAMLKCNTYRLPRHPEWFNEPLALLGARLILQVHDELIFEVPEKNALEAARVIKYTMENPFRRSLAVQLKADVEIGRSHGDCK